MDPSTVLIRAEVMPRKLRLASYLDMWQFICVHFYTCSFMHKSKYLASRSIKYFSNFLCTYISTKSADLILANSKKYN